MFDSALLKESRSMAAREITPSLSRLSVWISALALYVTFISIAVASPQKRYIGGVIPISDSLCDDMKTHHVIDSGSPVSCERLKLVKFGYVDFDGRPHDDGEIVVMDAAAEHVLQIFATLRNMRFPIAKSRLMNFYDGNDDASMADNNTSAFNFRNIRDAFSLSLHSYGLAIDINPIQNPFAKRSGATLTFAPASGADFANRLNDRPWKATRSGMAESVIDVFANNGFSIWGGYWDDPIDYQHFQVDRKLAEKLAALPPREARAVFNRHVARYRACRRRSLHGAESSRSLCVMTADTEWG
jgi:D-alanyl-D-alanine carboxypeptidase-like protein